jgi:hypothetical protein
VFIFLHHLVHREKAGVQMFSTYRQGQPT